MVYKLLYYQLTSSTVGDSVSLKNLLTRPRAKQQKKGTVCSTGVLCRGRRSFVVLRYSTIFKKPKVSQIFDYFNKIGDYDTE